MDFDDLKIHQGLNSLLKADNYLLSNNLSERAITHKLAEYYQNLFHEWNVDCEFNRNLGQPKKINVNPKEVLKQMADTLKATEYLHGIEFPDLAHLNRKDLVDLEKQLRNPKLDYISELDIVLFVLRLNDGKEIKKTIYPDIIIHHRGTSDNHIVIEAKKTKNVIKKARAYDFVKLISMVNSPELNYRRGYFIDIPVKKDLSKFNNFSKSILFKNDVYIIKPIY